MTLCISCLFCTSCTNDLMEIEETQIAPEEIINTLKDSITTRTATKLDTLRYPSVYLNIDHGSYYEHEIIIFDIPRIQEYTLNSKGLHPEYPTYNWTLGEACYIQYREKDIGGDRNWYYYHPDTVRSKTPYLIEVPHFHPEDKSSLTVNLDATKFPRAPFDYRVKLLGEKKSSIVQGRIVINETEWEEKNFGMPWKLNSSGFFVGNGNEDVEERPRIDVHIEIHLDITLRLRAGTNATRYYLEYNHEGKEFRLSSNEETFHHTFIIDKFAHAVFLNSIHEELITFEGNLYKIQIYIDDSYKVVHEDIFIERTANLAP